MPTTLAKPKKATPSKQKVSKNPSSALAGAPISLMRTTPLDIVLEKPLRVPSAVLPFLTGYKQPSQEEVVKALHGKKGTKVGSVLGGTRASDVILSSREVGGEVTLRTSRPDVALGEEMEPDLRLTSLVMEGSSRFTDDDAWLVLELAGYDETPEEMAERINAQAFRMVNVVEHVPLPVAAALVDLLRTNGFHHLTIRQAVPRT